eukprot:11092-Heterococcus_DN1.PRE.1
MTVAAGAAQFTAHDVDYSYIHRSVETVLAIDVVDTVNIPLAQLQLMLDNSCKPVAHFINLARRPDSALLSSSLHACTRAYVIIQCCTCELIASLLYTEQCLTGF